MTKRISPFITILLLLLFAAGANAQQPVTKVTLGIKPDYWHSIKGGVTVGDVIDGKIAHKAGIQAKDVIVGFDDKIINDIFGYRDLLNKYAPGDKVKITVFRNKKVMLFHITF